MRAPGFAPSFSALTWARLPLSHSILLLATRELFPYSEGNGTPFHTRAGSAACAERRPWLHRSPSAFSNPLAQRRPGGIVRSSGGNHRQVKIEAAPQRHVSAPSSWKPYHLPLQPVDSFPGQKARCQLPGSSRTFWLHKAPGQPTREQPPGAPHRASPDTREKPPIPRNMSCELPRRHLPSPLSGLQQESKFSMRSSLLLRGLNTWTRSGIHRRPIGSGCRRRGSPN